jgi:hypothetical protein
MAAESFGDDEITPKDEKHNMFESDMWWKCFPDIDEVCFKKKFLFLFFSPFLRLLQK